MYWPKHKMKEEHFERDRGSFIPFTSLGIAPARQVGGTKF